MFLIFADGRQLGSFHRLPLIESWLGIRGGGGCFESIVLGPGSTLYRIQIRSGFFFRTKLFVFRSGEACAVVSR